MGAKRTGTLWWLAVAAWWALLAGAAWAQYVPPTYEGIFHAGRWAVAGAVCGLAIGGLLGMTPTATGMDISVLCAAGGFLGGLVGGPTGGLLGWGLATYTDSAGAETLMGTLGIVIGGLFGGAVTRRHYKRVSQLIWDVEIGDVIPPPVEPTDEEIEETQSPEAIHPPPPRPGI